MPWFRKAIAPLPMGVKRFGDIAGRVRGRGVLVQRRPARVVVGWFLGRRYLFDRVDRSGRGLSLGSRRDIEAADRFQGVGINQGGYTRDLARSRVLPQERLTLEGGAV